MVSGPWRFSKIRPIFANFGKFPKITPKIGVFPPKIGYFRVFSGFFREISGPSKPGPAPTPKFREIFGKFRVRRRRPVDPLWDPFGTRLGPGGPCLGSVWGPSRGPFGVRLGVRLGSVWDPIGTLFGVPYGP